MTITTETITLKSGGSQRPRWDMGAYVARPESGRAPGLIVLQEAFGVNDHIKDVAKRFAQQGYLAVAPELFHRTAPQGFTADYGDFASLAPHMQGLSTDGITEDVRAAFSWLIQDAQCDRERIGSIGFCMGGRSSFIANAKLPLKAAVSFYGGGIVGDAIAPNLLEFVPEESGPMLFFWGGLDAHIPPEQRRAVVDAMASAGKQCISVEVSDVGHGFFCDARQAYNANAARQSWALTISFLATYLK